MTPVEQQLHDWVRRDLDMVAAAIRAGWPGKVGLAWHSAHHADVTYNGSTVCTVLVEEVSSTEACVRTKWIDTIMQAGAKRAAGGRL